MICDIFLMFAGMEKYGSDVFLVDFLGYFCEGYAVLPVLQVTY